MGTIELPGAIQIADCRFDELVEALASRAVNTVNDRGPARVFTALHVGGLNQLDNAEYVEALKSCDVVYADGVAVVALAKAAGARRVERAATTDLGVPLLRVLGRKLGRPARTALIGGPPGLAGRAGTALAAQAGVDVVATWNGYSDLRSSGALPDGLKSLPIDVLIVGLGVPGETIWSVRAARELSGSVVLTCGGWFGFLVGDEARAPLWMQRSGLEWMARVAQDPGRLVGRYLMGGITTLRLAGRILRERRNGGT